MTVYNPEKLTNEQRRKALAEELWLSYFNRVLYERGLITELERNRMSNLIADRSSGKERQKNKPKALPGKHMIWREEGN